MPSATLALTLTISVNVALNPEPKVLIRQSTVPGWPLGFEQMNVGPVFCARETNVVPGGGGFVQMDVDCAIRTGVGNPDRIADLLSGGDRCRPALRHGKIGAGDGEAADRSIQPTGRWSSSPLAVLVKVVPAGVAGGMFPVRVNVATAPLSIVVRLQVVVAPGVQVKVGPLSCVSETNVIVPGSVSVHDTFCASGPGRCSSP